MKKKTLQKASKLVQQYGFNLSRTEQDPACHFQELKWQRAMQYSQIRLYIAQRLSGNHHEDQITVQIIMSFLSQQLEIAEEKGTVSTVLEVRILQALISYVTERQNNAMGFLQKALRIAEPEGYVRIFIDEGEPMARLLGHAVKKGIFVEYTRHLLTVFKNEINLSPPSTSPTKPRQEPISKRELEVLKLVAAGLSNKDIAENLFLARNTVKRHISNIYAKLNVHNRVNAISKAKKIELL